MHRCRCYHTPFCLSPRTLGKLNGGGANSGGGSVGSDYLNYVYDADGSLMIEGKLPSITDGSYMCYRSKAKSVKLDVPNLTKGSYMFSDSQISDFEIQLPKLTDGTSMLKNNVNFDSWSINLPELTNGSEMFYSCGQQTGTGNKGIKEFNAIMPKLTNGYSMFNRCYQLAIFNSDLSSLTDAQYMFYSSALKTWDTDMPSLKDGTQMFYGADFTSFNSDLSSLENGVNMFNYCSYMTSFRGALSSLTSGGSMFGSSASTCSKLDLASVEHIAETINDLAAKGLTGKISIGISKSIQASDALESALATIRAKGWTVTENYA